MPGGCLKGGEKTTPLKEREVDGKPIDKKANR